MTPFPFRRLLPALALLTASALTSACAPSAGAEAEAGALHRVEGLGALSFPNSGAPGAQDPFMRGVLLLHSFEYEDAARSFRRAQAADPDFALAYWGEAMTYNHPVWMRQDRDAALKALERLAPGPEERLAKAATEREKDWLRAVEVLYGEGEKEERDLRYEDAMEALVERYPDDMEARAFYALSMLGTAHDGRDFATYVRAAAAVQPVFEANPDHPGAAHYLIHAFDDPVHAPLGLEAARAYASVAPDAAHAQHMTSHIFVALGMWDDVVQANETARAVQNARLRELGRPGALCGHYTSWLEYGYLMQGRVEDAARVLEACQERIRAGGADPGEASYYVQMRARWIIDTRDWASAEERWTADVGRAAWTRVPYDFTTAFARLRAGDAAGGRELAEGVVRMASSGDVSPQDRLLADELEALLALDAGRTDEAVELLRAAAAAEASLPYEFGPPAVLKPTWELLGEALLELGRGEEAAEAFRTALARTPGRSLAAEGLSRATELGGSR